MTRILRALTLHQPVASLMGEPPLKNIENRKWRPPASILGKRIALHAGKTWNPTYSQWAWRLRQSDPAWPLATIRNVIEMARGVSSAIVSTAVVSDWYDASGTNKSVCEAIAASPWFLGPVGWLLTDIRKLTTPIPCKGAQGLWVVPEDIAARIEAQGAG